MNTSPHIPTWKLRARFAAELSRMYGAEVPAYTTLVEVSAAVNADHIAANPDAERLGSLDRVTAERHRRPLTLFRFGVFGSPYERLWDAKTTKTRRGSR